jgi:hypothetical protein
MQNALKQVLGRNRLRTILVVPTTWKVILKALLNKGFREQAF